MRLQFAVILADWREHTQPLGRFKLGSGRGLGEFDRIGYVRRRRVSLGHAAFSAPVGSEKELFANVDACLPFGGTERLESRTARVENGP